MKPIKPQQLEFLDWELGAFFHFGIRTFYEGHRDWDMKEMPLSGFCPTALDCRNWIQTAYDAGAKYAILVCKHHDGFANWPSAYTDYSVANTPWKGGKGDVVREFVDACREFGMKVGLYYSPAEFGSKNRDSKDHDQYFIHQIGELLTNYGKIDYLWFDGCGSEGHRYDTKRIVAEIRRLQPEILLFNLWDPDTRWCGNESGLAEMPNENVVRMVDFSIQTQAREFLEEDTFLPVECDCRIRLENWFYSDRDAHTLKSLEELMGLYYGSVGRGANLLVNIAPDRRGLLPEADAARFVAFGQKVKRLFEKPLATIAQTVRTGDTYTVTLPDQTLVDHVILEEDLTEGGRIRAFTVSIHPYPYGRPIPVYLGQTVGHKHICHFPAVRTNKIEITITGESARHTLRNIGVYDGTHWESGKACDPADK